MPRTSRRSKRSRKKSPNRRYRACETPLKDLDDRYKEARHKLKIECFEKRRGYIEEIVPELKAIVPELKAMQAEMKKKNERKKKVEKKLNAVHPNYGKNVAIVWEPGQEYEFDRSGNKIRSNPIHKFRLEFPENKSEEINLDESGKYSFPY